MERLTISRMMVDLLRPLSLAICMGVQPSWMRKSIRFLSSMVICFAILAILSFCFAASLVRTRRLEVPKWKECQQIIHIHYFFRETLLTVNKQV